LSVPDSIRVNVGELQLEGVIHVRDLVLPEGVKAKAEPEGVVVHVKLKQVEAEAPAAAVPAAAAEQAEPEVIGRQKAAEEEPEEK
jgi:large subunit ribosomal protein L25